MNESSKKSMAPDASSGKIGRSAEIVLSIVLLVLAVSIGTIVVLLVANPPTVKGSPYTFWSLIFLLSFVVVAGLLFGVRLAFPSRRMDGNRIVGVQGVRAFYVLWVFVMILGFSQGNKKAYAASVALALGLSIGIARSYYRHRRRNE